VTQAVAFVSGLGACFIGCGGDVEGAADGSPLPGAQDSSQDAPQEFEGGGIFVPPADAGMADTDAPPGDAADLYDGFSGARDGPDFSDRFVGGGIGPPPHEDASTIDVVSGIFVAPDAGPG
jgi:hypothetical protein